MPGLPDDNPKTAAGLGKASVQYVPATARLYLGQVMKTGAVKYGPFNWRQDRITASTYYDAMNRHMEAWFAGEDVDPESGQPHLAHAMACCAIVIDAREHGCLNDDRPVSKPTILLLAGMAVAKAAEAKPCQFHTFGGCDCR